MSRRVKWPPMISLAAASVAAACACDVAVAGGLPEPKPGDFTVTLDKKSPLSSDSEFARRLKWPKSPPYDVASERFSLHVPKGYSGGKAFGLIVWISPVEDGGPPDEWKAVLDSNRLAWVGANGAGNSRYSSIRSGLALDAAHSLVPHLDIDPRRVYIAGYSGGGRASSRLALAYPDVFTGGIFICGCNYIRKIPIPDQQGFVTPDFPKPPDAIFKKAQKESSLVLVTGENDFNAGQVRTVFEDGFLKDKFANAACFVVPGIGHDLPDAAWMGKILPALEFPLEEQARESSARAARAEGSEKLGEALDLYEKAARHGFRRQFGADALKAAESLREKLRVMESEMDALLESGERGRAAELARRVVALFGNMAGQKAKELAGAARPGK